MLRQFGGGDGGPEVRGVRGVGGDRRGWRAGSGRDVGGRGVPPAGEEFVTAGLPGFGLGDDAAQRAVAIAEGEEDALFGRRCGGGYGGGGAGAAARGAAAGGAGDAAGVMGVAVQCAESAAAVDWRFAVGDWRGVGGRSAAAGMREAAVGVGVDAEAGVAGGAERGAGFAIAEFSSGGRWGAADGMGAAAGGADAEERGSVGPGLAGGPGGVDWRFEIGDWRGAAGAVGCEGSGVCDFSAVVEGAGGTRGTDGALRDDWSGCPAGSPIAERAGRAGSGTGRREAELPSPGRRAGGEMEAWESAGAWSEVPFGG